MPKYNLTTEEIQILKDLMINYVTLTNDLNKIESKIEDVSNLHKSLVKEYETINGKLLNTRNSEGEFFKLMKEKYPVLTNLKELID